LNPGVQTGIPRKDRVTWRVFLTGWLVYSFFWTPYLIREHFPVLSLLENGSVNVERYVGWTDDIFRSPAGGAYINNNPGASLTAALPLLVFQPLLLRADHWNPGPPPTTSRDDGELFWRTLHEGRAFYFLLVEFLTVALVMAPLTAATAAYLCRSLIQSGILPRHAAAAALLYTLGTPVFFRAAHLNHNLLVADAGLAALLVVWGRPGKPLTWLRAATSGLLAGYAVLCDYSGVIVVAVLAGYVWLRCDGQPHRWRFVAMFTAGAIPGVLLLAIYQSWAFGSLYLPSQHFMTPTAPTSKGYRGFDWPSPALLWANFFDPRFGLFRYCPALLLAFLAPFTRRVRYRMPGRELWILFAYFAAFVLFCAANQYSWLQPLTGFRYLVPVVPVLTLLAMQGSQILPAPVRLGIAGLSCLQNLLLAAAHASTVPLAVSTLRDRSGELLWMIRLQDAGLPFTTGWVWASWLALIGGCLLIWYVPARPRGNDEIAVA
jgi:hypothetical protein